MFSTIIPAHMLNLFPTAQIGSIYCHIKNPALSGIRFRIIESPGNGWFICQAAGCPNAEAFPIQREAMFQVSCFITVPLSQEVKCLSLTSN